MRELLRELLRELQRELLRELQRELHESIFGPLFFFNFRYIKVGVWGNNNIGIKKCTTIFLWVWYFGEVGEIFKNFQKHPRGESFWKNGV